MILLYHKIENLQHDYNNLGISPENFKYQLEYIRKYFEIVPLSEHEEDTIAITFDDGFRDFYTAVFPYLKQQNIPATIFISTGKIGKKEEIWTTELMRLIFTGNRHKSRFCLKIPSFSYEFPVKNLEDKYLLYLALRRLCMKSEEYIQQCILEQLQTWSGLEKTGREEYMILSEKEIKELSESGLITIGAHSVGHISLGAFSKEYQEKEIRNSKLALERIIEKEVLYFSYPFGGSFDYNTDTIDILKQENFKKSYIALTHPGKDSDYEIPRVTMPNLGKGEFEKWFQEVLPENGRKEEPLQSIAGQINNKIVYIGKLEKDEQLINSSERIAIFGAGGRGKKLLQRLRAYGKDGDVECFIDNNRELRGKFIEGRKIIAVEEIGQYNPGIILLDSNFEKEIIEQLLAIGIGGIHWILV